MCMTRSQRPFKRSPRHVEQLRDMCRAFPPALSACGHGGPAARTGTVAPRSQAERGAGAAGEAGGGAAGGGVRGAQ
jgi:hypothetical protein